MEFRLAALAIPCLAGLAYLALYGAPAGFVVINAAALITALGWIAFGRIPGSPTARRVLAVSLLAALALPFAAGPAVDGVTRWLSIGGFSLHAGMLVVPLLAVLAADDRVAGAYLLLAAILVAFAQPDSGSALALAVASLAIWWTGRDRKFGAVGILGLFASLGASFNGDLPPQPFVEGILTDFNAASPLVPVALGASLVAGLALIAFDAEMRRTTRFALAGAMSGFGIAAILGNYPTPLVGYGAAAILGLGLALGQLRRPASVELQDGFVD